MNTSKKKTYQCCRNMHNWVMMQVQVTSKTKAQILCMKTSAFLKAREGCQGMKKNTNKINVPQGCQKRGMH